MHRSPLVDKSHIETKESRQGQGPPVVTSASAVVASRLMGKTTHIGSVLAVKSAIGLANICSPEAVRQSNGSAHLSFFSQRGKKAAAMHVTQISQILFNSN